MPLPGLFSAFYWPGDGASSGVPPSQSGYQYPYWFNPSTVSMGLQLPHVPYRVQKHIVGLRKRLWRKLPRRYQVLISVIKRLFGPGFAEAIKAVDDVSTDPAYKDMKQWNAHLAERIGQDPHIHENVSRMLAAYDQVSGSRSDRMLLVELAWLGRKHG